MTIRSSSKEFIKKNIIKEFIKNSSKPHQKNFKDSSKHHQRIQQNIIKEFIKDSSKKESKNSSKHHQRIHQRLIKKRIKEFIKENIALLDVFKTIFFYFSPSPDINLKCWIGFL